MRDRVTEKTVVVRLQRFLVSKGKRLRIATSTKQKRWGFGRYYLVDTKGVIDKNVDIEKLARKLGLLDPWETLKE
ncbi:MAG: hypothetical protein WAK55_05935 [Xanthobacteraceae bacterium]